MAKKKGFFGTLYRTTLPGLIQSQVKKHTRDSNKAEARADDLARQQRERADALAQGDRARAAAEQARQESSARAEQQRLEGLYQRTPEQQARLLYLQQQGALTGEQLFRQTGPLADQFATQVGQRLQTPPQIPFEDVLGPELALARQQVAAMANQRGIVGSGLELEQMGRAGVDLAIKQAGLRQQNAQINQDLIQETLNRAGGLSEVESGLGDASQTRLQRYLDTLRSQELTGVNAGENAYQAGLGRGFQAFGQGQTLGASAQQQGEQLGAGFDQMGLEALNQREQASRTQRQELMKLLGSAGLGAATGGFGLLPGMTAGGFSGLNAVRGGLGAATRTGAFSPYAGLDDFLGLTRTQGTPTSRLSNISPELLQSIRRSMGSTY